MQIEIWHTTKNGKTSYHTLIKEYSKNRLIPVKQINDISSLSELFKLIEKEAKATFMIYETIYNPKPSSSNRT